MAPYMGQFTCDLIIVGEKKIPVDNNPLFGPLPV